MAGRARTKRPSRSLTRFVADMYRPLGGAEYPTRRGGEIHSGNAPSTDPRTGAIGIRRGEDGAPRDRTARDAP